MKIWYAVFVLGSFAGVALEANPTGGTVASGSAAMSSTGKTLTITQTSPDAIINWSTFSIAYGETTKFVQPSQLSAVLNRVTGGQTSVIAGNLTANGQVFLINGNGVLVGKTGKVNTAAFTASTLDITDSDFLNGNLHFAGSSTETVENLGSITAQEGKIYLIGKYVSNGGSLTASKGTVGLAAGEDVFVAQQNSDGSTVQVNPNNAAVTSGGTGVSNAGKISAAMAELRAANGNIYSLAINNSGTVRATGVNRKGGKVWLVADGGNVSTSGTIQTNGGGYVETSATHVGASGHVSAGEGGKWNIDPTDTTISTAPDNGQLNINSKTLTTSLNSGTNASVTVTASGTLSGNLDITTPLTWSSTATLFLTVANDIDINAAISATKGGLSMSAGNVVNPQGALAVSSFALNGGVWSQVAGSAGLAKLPTFAATGDFEIASGATFDRFAGGNGGGSPYQIADIYGLQGIGSGNAALEGYNYIVTAPINASVTENWHNGSGFVPISNFTGMFNGNKETISNLNLSSVSLQNGLFSKNSGTLENVNISGASETGDLQVGLLVGQNTGIVAGCSVSGVINASATGADEDIGGLIGANQGTVSNSSANVTINLALIGQDADAIGGLIGEDLFNPTTTNCSSSGSINIKGTTGANLDDIGGLVGFEEGSVSGSTSKTALNISASGSSGVGGLVGGLQDGVIVNSSNSGAINFTGSTSDSGGLVGIVDDGGAITSSQNAGAVTVSTAAAGGNVVGGLVGLCDGSGAISFCSNSGTVSDLVAHVSNVGGLIGAAQTSPGAITNCSNTGAVKLGQQGSDIGGLIGQYDSSLDLVNNTNSGAITGAAGGTGFSVGGLVGDLAGGGTVSQCSSTGAITLSGGASDVGGLIGQFEDGDLNQCSANSTITLGAETESVGGLTGIGFSSGTIIGCTSAGSMMINGNSNLYTIEDVGGLAADNSGNILNCSSSVKITVKDAGADQGNPFIYFGGIVGYEGGTSLQEDSFTGSLSVTGANVTNIGGIVGTTSSATIIQCGNTGAITVAGTTASKIGGVAGAFNKTNGTLDVASDSNSGAVTVSSATSSDVGGIAGIAQNGTIRDSINSGAVKATGASEAVGGIAGSSQVTLRDDANTGAITGAAKNLNSGDCGGLAGLSTGSVTNCYNTGNVTGAGAAIGGLIGIDTASVRLAYNTGSVTVLGSGNIGVGGLIGNLISGSAGQVTLTYSTGKVAGSGTNIGGLTGIHSGVAGGVTSSYWNVQTSGQATSADGTAVATTALMDTESTYAGWDFTNDWAMPAKGTPYLLDFQQALQ